MRRYCPGAKPDEDIACLPAFAGVARSARFSRMTDAILSIYQRYEGEDHDLAITLTARILGVDELMVRRLVES